MASALSELLVSFGIVFDTKPLDAGKKKIDGTLAKLKKFGAALAGAFAVKQVFGFVEAQVAVGAELQHQADLLNISTKSLEQWRYAASFAEISAEELQGMFMRVSRAALMGAEGTGKHAAAMKKLVGEVKPTESVAEVFEQIGLKLAGMKDGFEKTALAAKFFGRADGQKVLELFKDGADGIRKFREEFEALGGGMGDFPKKAKEVEASQKRLGFVWDTLKTRIAGVLLPALEWVVIKLTKLGAAFIKITDGTEILGTAMVVLGALAAAQAIRIIAAYLPVILPFLLWAAAIAAVILVAEDLFGFFEGRRSLIGRVIDNMFGPGASDRVREWAHEVAATVGKLIDKVKEIFSDGTTTITQKFVALVGYILGDFHDNLVSAFGGAGAEVVSVMGAATATWLGAIVVACEKAGKAIKGVVGFLEAPIKNLVEGAPKEDAKNNADIAAGKRVATAEDFAPQGFFKKALAKIVGFKPQDAVPLRLAAASSFGPQGFGPPAALAGSQGAPSVVNNFAIAPGTPQAQQAQIASAAERGTRKGLANPHRAAAAGLGRTVPK